MRYTVHIVPVCKSYFQSTLFLKYTGWCFTLDSPAHST